MGKRRALVVPSLSTVLAMSLVASPGLGAQNIALGAAVTGFGTFGTALDFAGCPDPANPLAALSTITDGVSLAEGTIWCQNTVFWDWFEPESRGNSIVVDLGSLFAIDNVALQADNNDVYRVAMRASSADPWMNPLDFGKVDGAGMRTRSSLVGGGFLARELRITVVEDVPDFSDGWSSVSELIVEGRAVPEPASAALLATGAVLMLVVRRRRASSS